MTPGLPSAAATLKAWPHVAAGICVWDTVSPSSSSLIAHDGADASSATMPAEYCALAWAASQQRIFCGTKAGELRVFDLRMRRLSHRFEAHSDPVQHCFVLQKTGQLATLSSAAELKLWSLKNLELLDTMALHSSGRGVSVLGPKLSCAALLSERHLVTSGQAGMNKNVGISVCSYVPPHWLIFIFGIAFSPSQLLLTYSAPDVEAGAFAADQLGATLRLSSPPLCALAAASGSFTSCALTDERSLTLDLAEAPSNATNWIELRADNLAPPAIRSCEARAALGGSFFVKIGGSLNESTADADSNLDTNVDKCCRKDAGTCHTFPTLEVCEVEKWAVECHSCEVNSNPLGCPPFPSQVDGYVMHADDGLCDLFKLHCVIGVRVRNWMAWSSFAFSPSGAMRDNSGLPGLQHCFRELFAGDAVPQTDTFSYAPVGCGERPWQFSLVLHWQTSGGSPALHDFGAQDVSGPGRLPLVPQTPSGRPGSISSFTAAITPDVGLTPTGSSVTLELDFQSAGFALGDVLTLTPLPLAPFDFDVTADASIVSVAGASTQLIYTNLPGSMDCIWLRVGGFRVNGVECTATADSSSSSGQQTFSLSLRLPTPSYGLSADWALAHEASAGGTLLVASDVLAVKPMASLRQLRATVQAASTQTTLELAIQLGLWAGQVDVFITAPSLALRDVSSCTAAPGSPLLAVEVAVWEGKGCRLSQVSNPDPLAVLRLRLDAENRGAVPDTRDVVTMMMNWASRTDFVAAAEAYSIVPEFGGELASPAAGAVLAFSVRGSVGPLTIHFPTAVDSGYHECAALSFFQSAASSPLPRCLTFPHT
ncbi:unnamed protein product [Symbiodinium natans]|uniref:Uncharacterized protein n=1 Tax=Symbiodinium natans TaxID=878477 RepID=A0A812SGT4_9DINO|nr:unnamed protein product [Symbiodinium natans]